MILARSTEGAEEMLLLGLSHANVRELLKGRPIRLTTESHGAAIPLGWTVMVCCGETEASLIQQLQNAGAVTAETVVYAQSRTPKPSPSQ